MLACSSLEVVGGGSGRGALPWLASALGVAPLQRFPVEAEDVLRGSLGCSQALLELGGERQVSAGASPHTHLQPSRPKRFPNPTDSQGPQAYHLSFLPQARHTVRELS